MLISCTTDYFANNNLSIHFQYLITCQTHRYVLESLSKQTQVNFVMIVNQGNDCLVCFNLLRYKGCVYITLLLLRDIKMCSQKFARVKKLDGECTRVLSSQCHEFAITVFVLTLQFSYHFKGILQGIKNYNKHEFIEHVCS